MMRAAVAVHRGLHHATEGVGAREHGERPAGIDGQYGRQLPPADDAAHYAGRVIGKLLSAPERKLDRAVGLDSMPVVVLRFTVIQLAIEHIKRSGGGALRVLRANDSERRI